MKEDNELVRQLDAKIKETQKLSDEAQAWASRLGTLQNNLQVLKRARELLLEKGIGEQAHPPIPVFPPVPLNGAVPSAVPASHRSIGAMVVQILRDAGGAMSLADIWENLKVNGRNDVPLKTLGGVISQYVAKGQIERTGRAMYRAPIIHSGGGRLVGQQP